MALSHADGVLARHHRRVIERQERLSGVSRKMVGLARPALAAAVLACTTSVAFSELLTARWE